MKFAVFLMATGIALAQSVVTNLADAKWTHDKGDPPGSESVFLREDARTGGMELLVRFPAGHVIAPHWHPTTEHLTVLTGTIALGMGNTFDQSAMKDLSTGGYAAMPAEMHHSFMAKTAATIQVHGMGPFAINYVNPADDPRQQKK